MNPSGRRGDCPIPALVYRPPGEAIEEPQLSAGSHVGGRLGGGQAH